MRSCPKRQAQLRNGGRCGSCAVANRNWISIWVEWKSLCLDRIGVRRIRGLRPGTALAQAQGKTKHPQGRAGPESPSEFCHPIHGRAAFWSAIVANEVPDQGSSNQAHKKTIRAHPCRSCPVAYGDSRRRRARFGFQDKRNRGGRWRPPRRFSKPETDAVTASECSASRSASSARLSF